MAGEAVAQAGVGSRCLYSPPDLPGREPEDGRGRVQQQLGGPDGPGAPGRVSECLSLCPADPPIISLRPEVTGNKVKRGREVHIPDDLVECLEDLVL